MSASHRPFAGQTAVVTGAACVSASHRPFAGQTAVVTGATSGIGAAIARALTNGGAAVHALSRRADEGSVANSARGA